MGSHASSDLTYTIIVIIHAKAVFLYLYAHRSLAVIFGAPWNFVILCRIKCRDECVLEAFKRSKKTSISNHKTPWEMNTHPIPKFTSPLVYFSKSMGRSRSSEVVQFCVHRCLKYPVLCPQTSEIPSLLQYPVCWNTQFCVHRCLKYPVLCPTVGALAWPTPPPAESCPSACSGSNPQCLGCACTIYQALAPISSRSSVATCPRAHPSRPEAWRRCQARIRMVRV